MHSFFYYLCTYKYIGVRGFSQRGKRGLSDNGQVLVSVTRSRCLAPPTWQLHILFHLCNLPQSKECLMCTRTAAEATSHHAKCRWWRSSFLWGWISWTLKIDESVLAVVIHWHWSRQNRLTKNCNLVSYLLCLLVDTLCKTHRRWYPGRYG